MSIVEPKTQKVKNLEILSKNFLVPKWFYLNEDFFERFLVSSQLKEIINSKLLSLNESNIEEISSDLQRRIAFAKMPKHLEDEIIKKYSQNPVSIRIALTKFFPDISQNAFLNISGNQRVINAIKVMYSTKYSKKALEKYLKNNWFDVEIIIQDMIKPYCSGVIYTKDIFSNNSENSIVKVVLGHMLIESEFTGDVFVVNLDKIIHETTTIQKYAYVQDRTQSSTEKIELGKNSNLTKLEDKKVLEINEIAKFAESIFSSPLKLSFCYSENKFYLISATKLDLEEYSELEIVLKGYSPLIKKTILKESSNIEDAILLFSTKNAYDSNKIRNILETKTSSKEDCIELIKIAHDIVLKFH